MSQTKPTQKFLSRLWSGGDARRSSRFHTGENQLAPVRHWLNWIRSLIGLITERLTGKRPQLPWIPFSAIASLDRLIQPDWRILEIGSGYSTFWLARRSKHLVSFEADEGWFKRIGDQLVSRQVTNVDLRFEWQADRMSDFSEFPDKSIDLVFLDGGPREMCVLAALPKIRPGGLLYLDNSDLRETVDGAKMLLIDFATRTGSKMEVHRDFVPCALFVNEGLLLTVTPH